MIDYDPSDGWLESMEYRDYQQAIFKLVRATGTLGVCTNDIHKVLGREKQYMTQAALDGLELDVINRGARTFYRFQTRREIELRCNVYRTPRQRTEEAIV